MEPRFGHDFGQVRIHSDRRAAESAAAVDARAFTVGHKIVMGAGEYAPGTAEGQRLLAHELTHVVQQHQLRLSPAGALLQRAGFGEVRTTEGRLTEERPEQSRMPAGLPQPDCSTRVSDVFLLGAIYCPQRPECCFAQVHDRKNHALNGIFRADYLLEGKPDCAYGDQKHHDYWLANQWRIVEITTSEMTVMNMCGIEETLNIEGTGSVKGQSGSAMGASRITTSAPLPPNKVEGSPGMLGKTHEIRYDAGCNVIHFKPHDPAKPPSVYRWDAAQEAFVDVKDPTNIKTPGQLERLAGIVLKEYQNGEWQGTNCGELPPWAL